MKILSVTSFTGGLGVEGGETRDSDEGWKSINSWVPCVCIDQV